MSTDLVTGGAGFIGSHLVARLLRDGRRVRVVDDLSTGKIERLTPHLADIELVRADLATSPLGPVLAGVARVYHLAAIPSVPRSVKDPLTSHASIATATLRVLVAARDAGVERFVLSSSSSVYGDTAVSPKHERLPTNPLSPYAVAKMAAEQYARVFASLHGLHTVSLRYFNVFGPSQDPASQYAAVVPLFITRALAGAALRVNGDGEQTRDFTYVDNVVDANVAAATAAVQPGRVFNAAAGEPRSINQLVSAIGLILGVSPRVEHDPPRPGDVRHSAADATAARSELGWAPAVSFDEGLRRTVAWYRGP